jgi:hypothetical protein
MSKRFRYLIITSIIVLFAISLAPRVSNPTTVHAATTPLYTMSAFSNADQALYTYTSNNGLNFTKLGSGTGPVYTPPTGYVRDPSITRMGTTGRYYVTYTTAWSNNAIGLASSADRIHWTFVKNITFATTVNTAWAPEWFKDTDGTVNIIVHLRYKGAASPTPYVIRALNATWTSWSTPVPLAGLTPDYIDSFILKVNGVYHIFLKDDVTKYIEQATATKLAGPYKFVGTGNWAGWGPQLEGPCVYLLNDGKTWRITLDGYKTNQYYYSDSTNLKTWTAKKPLPGGLSGFVRHFTVLREPAS